MTPFMQVFYIHSVPQIINYFRRETISCSSTCWKLGNWINQFLLGRGTCLVWGSILGFVFGFRFFSLYPFLNPCSFFSTLLWHLLLWFEHGRCWIVFVKMNLSQHDHIWAHFTYNSRADGLLVSLLCDESQLAGSSQLLLPWNRFYYLFTICSTNMFPRTWATRM